jgi:hypothetical protein
MQNVTKTVANLACKQASFSENSQLRSFTLIAIKFKKTDAITEKTSMLEYK